MTSAALAGNDGACAEIALITMEKMNNSTIRCSTLRTPSMPDHNFEKILVNDQLSLIWNCLFESPSLGGRD